MRNKRSLAQLMAFVVLALGVSLAASACGGASGPVEFRIASPAANSEVELGSDLQIQGDVSGDNIVRLDVLVDGSPIARLSTGDPNKGVLSFPVRVTWQPTLVGTHIVQFAVYGLGESLMATSDPVFFSVKSPAVAGATSQPQPAATPSRFPTKVVRAAAPTAAPTAAPPTAQPAAATVIGEMANVREGPGTTYAIVGQLKQGDTSQVRGKSADGQWWQIAFPAARSGTGWVFGPLVQVSGPVAGVAVVQVAPPPTSTPGPAPTVAPTSAEATPAATAPATVATAAPATTYSGPPCDNKSPAWRGANPNYPFCVSQDLIWGDPQGDWMIYDNGKNIPLSASWNLFGPNIESVRIRFDPVDGVCPFNRPRDKWIDQAVQTADTFRFNAADFPSGAAMRVYLLVKLRDGREVTFGEKRLCVN